MSNESFKQVMKILKEEKKKYDQEQRAAKKALKKEQSRLTKAVKKAGHQSPNSLDSFSSENMYYSEQQTKDYLAGTSYMETYQATRNDWD